MGEVHDGLYLLQHSPSDACTLPINSKVLGSFQSIFNSVFKSVFSQPQSHVLNNTVVPSSIWHLRLGHPSDAKLFSLNNVLHDSVCTFNKDCEICELLEDHFSDLPEELFVFLPNDIVDNPQLHLDFVPSLSNPFDSSLRRSTRVSKPPAYLPSYKCNTLSTRYPIANFVSSHKLSHSYSHFYNSISALKEPQFYHQVVGDPNWEAAMAAELEALEQNHTWSIVSLPPNKKVVGCKWVFCIK